MGVFLEKWDILISKFIQNSVKCNTEARQKYEVNMGLVYAGLATFLPPMSQISIDLWGPIDVLCFPR